MKSTEKNLLRALKELAGTSGPQLILKIEGFDGYSLRPIPTRSDLLDALDIECLTNWRNRHVKSFLTEFLSTEERTTSWLSQTVLSDDGRILFMIENNHRERVGYMGIACIDWEASYVEADAIVSGGNTPKGLMSSALKTLLRWAKGQLGLRKVAVRVLSDNPAIDFYQKLGFTETKRVPLTRDVSNGFVSWKEDSTLTSAERYLVYHHWNDHEN